MRKGIDDSFYVFAAIFGVTVIGLKVIIGIINIFI